MAFIEAMHHNTPDISDKKLIEAEWRIYASVIEPSLVQITACRLIGAKPLSELFMAGKLLIARLGTNFSEIWIKIHTYSFKKMRLKMSSGNCRPFCLGLNVLTT